MAKDLGILSRLQQQQQQAPAQSGGQTVNVIPYSTLMQQTHNNAPVTNNLRELTTPLDQNLSPLEQFKQHRMRLNAAATAQRPQYPAWNTNAFPAAQSAGLNVGSNPFGGMPGGGGEAGSYGGDGQTPSGSFGPMTPEGLTMTNLVSRAIMGPVFGSMPGIAGMTAQGISMADAIAVQAGLMTPQEAAFNASLPAGIGMGSGFYGGGGYDNVGHEVSDNDSFSSIGGWGAWGDDNEGYGDSGSGGGDAGDGGMGMGSDGTPGGGSQSDNDGAMGGIW